MAIDYKDSCLNLCGFNINQLYSGTFSATLHKMEDRENGGRRPEGPPGPGGGRGAKSGGGAGERDRPGGAGQRRKKFIWYALGIPRGVIQLDISSAGRRQKKSASADAEALRCAVPVNPADPAAQEPGRPVPGRAGPGVRCRRTPRRSWLSPRPRPTRCWSPSPAAG